MKKGNRSAIRNSKSAMAFWLWGPVALYIGFIFWLSSAPRPVPPVMRWPGSDKLFHTFEYAPLGSLLIRAFTRSWTGTVFHRRHHVLVFIAAVAVGALDEIYQAFIPLRTSSFWDLLCDGMGALIGQFVYWRRGLYVVCKKEARTP